MAGDYKYIEEIGGQYSFFTKEEILPYKIKIRLMIYFVSLEKKEKNY